jgi:tripartite ATP-independent transporter DctM subunit
MTVEDGEVTRAPLSVDDGQVEPAPAIVDDPELRRARRLRRTGQAAQAVAGLTMSPAESLRWPWFSRVHLFTVRATEFVTVAALFLELFVMFANVILRSFFGLPLNWADEAGSDALTIIAFGGAAIAMQRGQMIAMDFVVQRLRSPYRQIAMAAGDWALIAAAIVICLLSQDMLNLGLTQTAPDYPFALQEFWTEICLPIGLVLFSLNVVGTRLVKYPVSALIMGALAAGVASLLIWVLVLLNPLGMDVNLALVVAIVVFLVLLLIGQPIAFGFLTSSLVFLWLSATVSAGTIPNTMWEGLRSPVLLAVPFFIWAGFILTLGGMSQYLAQFVSALIGHIRGGVLQVVVITMYLFSGLSGSKAADMAAVSSALKSIVADDVDSKASYTAVLNASAVMGETIPPSTGLIILASITSVSIIGLFLAGLIPALVLAVCLMAMIYVRARVNKTPTTKRAGIKVVARSLLFAIPALTVPVVLIIGVLGGFATPTEISAIAVIYSFLAATFLYRKTNLKILWNLTIETLAIAGTGLFALSAAGAFSFVLTIANIPQELGGFVTGAHLSPVLFMLFCAVFLFVLGSVLEGLPCLLIFAPLLLATATQLGIDPLQFVIVMLIAAHLGVHTPPIGVGYYIACLLTKTRPETAIRPSLGYLVVTFAGLLIVIFVPAVSTFLPSLAHTPG